MRISLLDGDWIGLRPDINISKRSTTELNFCTNRSTRFVHLGITRCRTNRGNCGGLRLIYLRHGLRYPIINPRVGIANFSWSIDFSIDFGHMLATRSPASLSLQPRLVIYFLWINLTVSNIQMFSDAYTADDIWKHYGKRRNCLNCVQNKQFHL